LEVHPSLIAHIDRLPIFLKEHRLPTADAQRALRVENVAELPLVAPEAGSATVSLAFA
jgi:hypothetical protein